jgi:LysM repeat protein
MSLKIHQVIRFQLLVFLFVFFFSACATTKKSFINSNSQDTVAKIIQDQQEVVIAPTNSNPTTAIDSNKKYVITEPVLGVNLKVNHFDYPVVVNERVEMWIQYFTGKGRYFFSKYLERGRFFIPEIAKILKQNNMPQDLVYLAMIESGFNNVAKSHARAVGPWQFMAFTGRRFGLKIDYWLDERRDTKRSTLAAIAYLRDLYNEFNSWELASAGYNAGENKIRRAIQKYKTNDFWILSKKPFFRSETKNYVPKIIAAAIIAKNPEQFGFEDPFKKGSEQKINPTTLLHLAEEKAQQDENDEQDISEPTPKEILSENNSESENDTSDDLAENADTHAVESSSPEPVLSPAVYMVANPNDKIIEYEIKSPADLFAVAHAAGLPYSTVKLLNPELRRWITPPYMKTYRIKLPLSVKQRFLATYNDSNFNKQIVFQNYTIKRGDTLSKVAKKFKIEKEAIFELNNLSKFSESLPLGKTIALPIPTGYKRVIASQYDDKPEPKTRKRFRRHKRRRSFSSVGRHYSSYSSGITKYRTLKRVRPKK